MRDPWDDAELARRFREFATTFRRRAPLYAALSTGVAADPELYGLLHHAPPTQQLPVLLFATTHKLLLDDPDHPLSAWYPNLTEGHRSPDDDQLVPTFKRFVRDRAPDLLHLLQTRSIQTNEVGRCLMLMPAMALVSAECGPLAHLDVGASGGLNLSIDRYAYRYEPEGSPDAVRVVGGNSSLQLVASTRGTGPIPDTLPTIAVRCGVDRSPIDVTDDAEAHWLEACVWPDQRERFLQLRAAIQIARNSPPELLAGDAVQSLEPAITRLSRSGHPIVTNSWVLNYLPPDARMRYVDELDRIGAATDLSWVFSEGPDMTPDLPWTHASPTGETRTVTALATWRRGRRTIRELSASHPHGFWIHWRD